MALLRLLPVALAAMLLSGLSPPAVAASGAREPAHKHVQRTPTRSRRASPNRHLARAHAGHEAGSGQTGEASWYGTRHEGRRTANGERFDPHEMTAAHPSLPMNSRVKVTNLVNGRTVTVRINDRLPSRSRRIIDLTPRAASEIGMQARGHTRVEIQNIASESAPPR